VPIREDFNTIDNPFAWSSKPGECNTAVATAGLHFVAFVPTSNKFHTARTSMDGILPDGTNLATCGIDTAHNGINSVISATHRQNFLVPPRAHRSFPLAELL